MFLTIKNGIEFLLDKKNRKNGVAYEDYPLMGSIVPVLIIDILYYMFVFHIGPYLMKNRQPFNLKKVLVIYNILQIFGNSIPAICGFFLLTSSEYPYSFSCMLKIEDSHHLRYYEFNLSYIYYILKYIDYFDTIFFVLRKSYRQVTFLHVYHHLSMSFFGFLYTKIYGLGGHFAIPGLINCYIHIVMYAYYLLTALKPGMKDSIAWKRHITELQLVQFFTCLIHQAWPLVIKTDCAFPKFWLLLSTLQGVTMVYLFAKFYKKTYLSNTKKNIENTNKKVQ